MKKTDRNTPSRKLVIRREAIAMLTHSQLPNVVGGIDDCSACSHCCPDWDPVRVEQRARK